MRARSIVFAAEYMHHRQHTLTHRATGGDAEMCTRVRAYQLETAKQPKGATPTPETLAVNTPTGVTLQGPNNGQPGDSTSRILHVYEIDCCCEE